MKASVAFFASLVMTAGLSLLSPHNTLAQEDEERFEEGRVYVMSNESTGNSVIVFARAENGTLTRIQQVSTGGLGSGPGPRPPQFPPGPGPDPLNSQDAITLTENGRFLLAVNARSNDVSVLAVTRKGLHLVDKKPSNGIFPVSVTVRKGLVYVLNQGASPTNSVQGAGSITGFFLDFEGKLHEIPNSTRQIGDAGAAPGDVVIDPDGELVIVSETLANFIDVFHLREDGRTEKKSIRFPSNNRTPLAFDFTHRHIVALTEGNEAVAQTGTPGGSSTSTYRVTDETLIPISKAVTNHQTANCWVRFTPDGRFAYTGNTGSGSISSYSVSPRGELTLLAGVAADTGGPASVPIDLDITRDGKYLYVLAAFIGTVEGWRIEENGSLTPVESIPGMPVSIQGLKAR